MVYLKLYILEWLGILELVSVDDLSQIIHTRLTWYYRTRIDGLKIDNKL